MFKLEINFHFKTPHNRCTNPRTLLRNHPKSFMKTDPNNRNLKFHTRKRFVGSEKRLMYGTGIVPSSIVYNFTNMQKERPIFTTLLSQMINIPGEPRNYRVLEGFLFYSSGDRCFEPSTTTIVLFTICYTPDDRN